MPSRTVAIAMAFSLALVSGAFAGQNENATFALVGDAEVTGVGAGDRVSLEVSAEGFVGVKQLQVVLEVSDGAHFNLGSARLELGPGSMTFRPWWPLPRPWKGATSRLSWGVPSWGAIRSMGPPALRFPSGPPTALPAKPRPR